MKESYLFLKRWLVNPLRLGAVFPSSRFLAQVVAAAAVKDLGPDEFILELGPGTGRFTRALIEAGVPEDRLICVELDRELLGYLKRQFPQAHLIAGNACHLLNLIPAELRGKIGATVSGLPMVNFSAVAQEMILEGCFRVMKPSGHFIQFTYSPFSSIAAERFSLTKQRIAWVMRNLPPASVWVYQRP